MHTCRAATNESQKTLNKCETRKNCFSHSSASPRNDKQCSAKQCFANQTNRSLAGFASRSDLFRDNARLTKHCRKVNQRHLILQAMYTTMWLEIDCWLAVSHMFRWKLDSRIHFLPPRVACTTGLSHNPFTWRPLKDGKKRLREKVVLCNHM